LAGLYQTRAAASEPEFQRFDLSIAGPPRVAHRALVIVPRHLDPELDHPLLLLLHGYAPSLDETRAVYAWRDEYGIEDSYRRLREAPLRPLQPRLGWFDAERLSTLNRALAREALRGLVLVCPMTPVPYFAEQRLDRFAEWVQGALLPLVQSVAKVRLARQATGLSGVSMGGRVGLELLLRRPQLFGAFSGLQIDITPEEAPGYAARLVSAFERHGPAKLCIQTSTRDVYRDANVRLHEELRERGVSCELLLSPGAHNATWLRELAGAEALCFQDRALRASADSGGQLAIAASLPNVP
jgi:acetyl esterase/lipase